MHEIVSFQEKYTQEVLELIGGIFVEYGLTFEPAGYDADLTRIPDAYFASGGAFWVLLDGRRVVGTVAVVPLSPSEVEVKRVYLHASLRGQGLGRTLVEHAMGWARERGYTKVILWSDVHFTRSHLLYEKLGFVRVGIRDCDDIDQSREYGFEKDL